MLERAINKKLLNQNKNSNNQENNNFVNMNSQLK